MRVREIPGVTQVEKGHAGNPVTAYIGGNMVWAAVLLKENIK